MDDRWLKSDVLTRRMQMEADWGPYWACSVLQDMRLVFDKQGKMPEQPLVMFMTDMAPALQHHLHHDGRWVVMLTHPRPPASPNAMFIEYARFAFVWLDSDGDPQFTVENEEVWWKILTAGQECWLEQAELAWQSWFRAMRHVLEPNPETELYKKAQGQKAPSIY